MDPGSYRAGVAELYAAEVLGEGLASRWLELSAGAVQKAAGEGVMDRVLLTMLSYPLVRGEPAVR